MTVRWDGRALSAAVREVKVGFGSIGSARMLAVQAYMVVRMHSAAGDTASPAAAWSFLPHTSPPRICVAQSVSYKVP